MKLPKSPGVKDLENIRDRLKDKDPLSVSEGLARLEPADRATLFRMLSKDQSLKVFEHLNPAHQEELLTGLRDEQVLHLVEQMAPDDRARLFDEMPALVVKRLLSGLSPEQQEMTALLLGYPKESAGRIMTPQVLKLHPKMTVSEALELFRQEGGGVENHYIMPVTGTQACLLGTVELKDLLLSPEEMTIEKVMDKEPHSVRVNEDQEEVARLIQSADLLAVPVVDMEERLVGLVTVDDAMDILTLEEGEDLARSAAAEPLRRPYFSVSIFRLARGRLVWLLLLIVASTLTVNVLDAFENTLQAAVGLAIFIPLLIGTGGNAGAQSSTTIVRSMAVGDLEINDFLHTAGREIMVGLQVGIMLGALSLIPVWLYAGQAMAVVVALTLIAICTLATLTGAMMPILARTAGVDPAVVSAPLVTTVVDATGLLVYLLIARAVLNL